MTNFAVNSDSHNSLILESAEEHYCTNCATYLDENRECSCDFNHYDSDDFDICYPESEYKDSAINTEKSLDVNKINGVSEKIWMLGTDILSDFDLELMEKGKAASFVRECGAIYCILKCSDFREELIDCGYSQLFLELVYEGQKRGYDWLFFDRDISTEIKN